MKPSRTLLFSCALAATLTAAACRERAPSEPTYEFGGMMVPTDTVALATNLEAFQEVFAKWASTRSPHYSIDQVVSCFCGGDVVGSPNRLVVIQSVVVSATKYSGRPVADPYNQLKSVEALWFEAIDAARKGERVRLTYHRTQFYPVTVILGEPERDAGVVYVNGNLRRR